MMDGTTRKISRVSWNLRFGERARPPRDVQKMRVRNATDKKRKSFQRSAKPTRPKIANIHSGKGLAMAYQMQTIEADEVARNGVLGTHFGQR
jgi:hypothetical protein